MMKCILYLLIGLFSLESTAQISTILRSDTLIWSGNINLSANALFTEQQTLKILPGTIVTARGPYIIEIRGNILAIGTMDNPIIFTASDTLGLSDTTTITGGWSGIQLLNNENGTGFFSYCTFKFGKANVPGSWHGGQGYNDTISGNQGGAIRINCYHQVAFLNCTFTNNYSRSRGGAIYANQISNLNIIDCYFSDNVSFYWGGALYCTNHDSLLIEHTSFQKNKAELSYGGGAAIYLKNSIGNSLNTINRNAFFNNTSLVTASLNVSDVNFQNNLMTNNFNRFTLQFSLVSSNVYVVNNTIANNYFYYGIPGIVSGSENCHIYNTVLWNNLSDTIEPDDQVIYWSEQKPDINYNLIWEGRAPGSNILKDDPKFVNPSPGFGLESNGWEYDWSLQDDSPAVNAGTPDTSGMNLPPTDLAGNPRIFGNRIDMGAYENQHVWVKINDSPAFENQIKVYPNPGTDRIMVQLPENTQEAWIELMDGTGKQVLNQRVYSSLCVFTPAHLISGIYFYRIYNQEQVFKKGKWVKL